MARGADCTHVHLTRLIAGVKRARLDVDDVSLASGSADVLGYEVFLANSYCSGTGKRLARFSVSRHGRSLRLVASVSERRSSSMVTSLSWRSAIVVLSQSLMPAFKFAWASSGRRRSRGRRGSTVRMEQRASAGFYVSSAILGHAIFHPNLLRLSLFYSDKVLFWCAILVICAVP